MRKIFLVFLSLVLCCTLVYAAAESTSEAAKLPQPVAVESAEDFNGKWVPYGMISEGQLFPFAEADIAVMVQLTIENGKVTTHIDAVEDVEDGVFDFTFEDGVLKFDDSSSTVPSRSTLSMQDDGSLRFSTVLSYEGEESEIVYVYNRQDAAEEAPAAG